MLRAIGHLSRYVDRYSYGWVGYDMEDISLHSFTESDFAGCNQGNTSVSVVFLVLECPNTYSPIGYLSKMMGHVAYSTPEAGIAAICFGLRTAGSPGMIMSELTSEQDHKRKPSSPRNLLPHTLILHGDSSASVAISKSGKNPTMRHMGSRTWSQPIVVEQRDQEQASEYWLY